MIAFLVMAVLFSSILYSATKYTYTTLNKIPSLSSLVILCSTIAVLYVPREFSECSYNPIDDHVEVSFLLIMSELARVVYGIPTDTLAPATTAAHIAANLATKLGDPCTNAQFSIAVVIVVSCILIQITRKRQQRKRRPTPLVNMDLTDPVGESSTLPSTQQTNLLRF